MGKEMGRVLPFPADWRVSERRKVPDRVLIRAPVIKSFIRLSFSSRYRNDSVMVPEVKL